MKMISNLLKKYKELITYVIFGGLTTVVNLVSFKLFNIILGEEYYLISNVIAWFIAVIFAYVTNKLFVFESRSWKANVIIKEIISFFAARVFSLGIEELGLWILVDLLRFDTYSISIFGIVIGGKMIAKIVLAVIVVVLNYIFSKLVIFKKKDK